MSYYSSNRSKRYIRGIRPNVISDDMVKSQIGLIDTHNTNPNFEVCYIKSEEYEGPYERNSVMNTRYNGVEKADDAIIFCNRIVEKRDPTNFPDFPYVFTKVMAPRKKLFGIF